MKKSVKYKNISLEIRLLQSYHASLRGTWVKSVRYSALCSILLFVTATTLFAQRKPLNLQDCINIAIKNNLQLKTASLEVEQSKALHKTSFDPPKTNLMLTQDPTSGGNIDNSLGVIQSFSLPGLYKNQRNVLQQQTLLIDKGKSLTQAEIIQNVKKSYYDLLYAFEKIKVLNYLDSIYSDFSKKSEVRQRTGETSNLEKLAAQSKYQEVQLSKKEAQADARVNEYSLQQLLNTNQPVAIADDTLLPIPLVGLLDTIYKNPLIDYYQQSIHVSNSKIKLEKAKALPEFTVGYSQQLVIKGFDPAKINRDYFNGTRIAGLQIGVGVPLFYGSYKARINAEKISVSVGESQLASTQQKLKSQWQQAYQEYLKYKESLKYYKSTGLQLANEQIRVAQFSFSKGEIGYVEYIQNISLAMQTKLNYLLTLNLLNSAVINLQYLQGNQQ